MNHWRFGFFEEKPEDLNISSGRDSAKAQDSAELACPERWSRLALGV